jgi:hypothetical protein
MIGTKETRTHGKPLKMGRHHHDKICWLPTPETAEGVPEGQGSGLNARFAESSRKMKALECPFEKRYRNVAAWLRDGWIEIGYREGSSSFIRVLDEGGMVWEGKRQYANVDEALRDAEEGISACLGNIS